MIPEPFIPQHTDHKENDTSYVEDARYMYLWMEVIEKPTAQIKLRWAISPTFDEVKDYEFIGFHDNGKLPKFKKIVGDKK